MLCSPLLTRQPGHRPCCRGSPMCSVCRRRSRVCSCRSGGRDRCFLRLSDPTGPASAPQEVGVRRRCADPVDVSRIHGVDRCGKRIGGRPSVAAGLVLFSLGRCLGSISSKDVQGRTVPKGQRGRSTGWRRSRPGWSSSPSDSASVSSVVRISRPVSLPGFWSAVPPAGSGWPPSTPASASRPTSRRRRVRVVAMPLAPQGRSRSVRAELGSPP